MHILQDMGLIQVWTSCNDLQGCSRSWH